MKNECQKKDIVTHRGAAIKIGIAVLLVLLISVLPVSASSYYLNIDVEAESYLHPCYAVFTFTSTSCTNLTVDFGDGSKLLNLTEDTKMQPYLYEKPGTYTVTFSGTAPDGSSVSTSKVIVVSVFAKDGEITINKTEEPAYYLGESFTVSGTNTYSDKVALYIQGTNFRLTPLVSKPIQVAADGTWNVTIDSSIISDPNGRKMDVGTYTLIAVASDGTIPTTLSDCLRAVTATAFKQPYVGGLNISYAIQKGDNLTITGVATGAVDSLRYYLFGEGTMNCGFITVEDDDSFTHMISTNGLTFGNYYLVVQHPMYDKKFNISPVSDSDGSTSIVMTGWGGEVYLFKVDDRRSVNAAQALCDALDSQNIDDMYVKTTIIVYPSHEVTDIITIDADVTQNEDELSGSVSGFCTADDAVSLYLQYPNGTVISLSAVPAPCNEISAYSTEFTVSNITTAGEHTLYAAAGNPANNLAAITAVPHAEFVHDVEILGTLSGDVVMKGSTVSISGTTSAGGLQYYLFGPSVFETGTVPILNGSYDYVINTASLDIGEYAVVLQSAGQDAVFNIGPDGNIIMLNRTGSYQNSDSIYLFDVSDRNSANAARALCDAIDTQYIDDVYLDFSFTVIGKSISLNQVSDIRVGEKFTVSGTAENLDSDVVTLIITPAGSSSVVCSTSAAVADDGTWSCILDTSALSVGEYQLTVSADSLVSTIQTIHVREKLSTLTITSAKEVVLNGNPIIVSGLAEGALLVQYYVFGTNFFESGAAVVVDDAYELSIPSGKMSAGQYFLVLQHPMYDGLFNIGPKGTEIVFHPDSYTMPDSMILFDVSYRQTANAAQALCDALDSQNIDDIYIKYSFFVANTAGDSGWVNSLPVSVVRGSLIPVSGGIELGGGIPVTVEMISTAFAAVPKETVGSEAFLSMTTETDGNGYWNLTLNTGGLNVDEYAITVTIDGRVLTTSRLSLIEAVPTPPTPIPTPTPTPTPDDFIPEPETLTELQLQKGWNFVSIQKTLDAANNTASKVFSGVDTADNAILGYNASAQRWEQITANTIIKPLTGYWIYAAETACIQLQYSETPVSPAVKTLYEGWNAVGLSAGSSTTAASAFAGVEWRTVLPWNLENGGWGTPLVNGGSSTNSAEQYLKLGNGSWLYVDADGTLVGLIA